MTKKSIFENYRESRSYATPESNGGKRTYVDTSLYTPKKVHLQRSKNPIVLDPETKKRIEEFKYACFKRKRYEFGETGALGGIFYGFPGTGKTKTIMDIIYKEFKESIRTEGVEIIEGERTPKAIKDMFEYARKRTRLGKEIIIIYDEFETIASRDNTGNREVVSVLKTEFDGNGSNDGIYILATTNYMSEIDPALKRGGRLSFEIEFNLPDLNQRYEIINSVCSTVGYTVKDELRKYIAERTSGYTPADLIDFLGRAYSIELRRTGNKEVSKESTDLAISLFTPTVKKTITYFKEPSVDFNDLILTGYEHHVEILDALFSLEEGANILLYGPHGTGKTTLTEAFAKKNKFNYIFISGSELENKFVGETTERLKKVLKTAELSKPCIVVFDEIEGLLGSYGSYKRDQINYFLSYLSKSKENVYIVGTTNNPELLGRTITRFPYKGFVPLPSKEFIREYAKRKGVEIEYREDMSIRDVEKLVKNMLIAKKLGKEYRRSLLSLENEYSQKAWDEVRMEIGDIFTDIM